MKIAFVGKGGSGKSTLSALFIRHLEAAGTNVLAIDADLNMNMSSLLGVSTPTGNWLAQPDVSTALRQHLKGSNPRIPGVEHFLPTTPPGQGSNLIRRADDPALAPFAVTVSDTPAIRLLSVGNYDTAGIGQTCYHSHLFVAENLLSHTATDNNFAVVADMVAGTDAFAYSLHLQFDAVFLIAEPTPESVEVCRAYEALARDAHMDKLVHVIANKVADADDLAFIETALGRKVIASLPLLPTLKKARQRGEIASLAMLGDDAAIFPALVEAARSPAISAQERLGLLHALHNKLAKKEWVKTGYGDVTGQVDPHFSGEAA